MINSLDAIEISILALGLSNVVIAFAIITLMRRSAPHDPHAPARKVNPKKLHAIAKRAVHATEEHAIWQHKTNGAQLTSEDKRRTAMKIALEDPRARGIHERLIAVEIAAQLGEIRSLKTEPKP